MYQETKSVALGFDSMRGALRQLKVDASEQKVTEMLEKLNHLEWIVSDTFDELFKKEAKDD